MSHQSQASVYGSEFSNDMLGLQSNLFVLDSHDGGEHNCHWTHPKLDSACSKLGDCISVVWFEIHQAHPGTDVHSRRDSHVPHLRSVLLGIRGSSLASNALLPWQSPDWTAKQKKRKIIFEFTKLCFTSNEQDITFSNIPMFESLLLKRTEVTAGMEINAVSYEHFDCWIPGHPAGRNA
jgi:hypothetical protein